MLTPCVRVFALNSSSFPLRLPSSSETARRLYKHLETSAHTQEVRLAAREGLFLLHGKQFSYEQERRKEQELLRRQRALVQKRLDADGLAAGHKDEAELGYSVGDFVKLTKLADKQAQFAGLIGEVRMGWCSMRVSRVWQETCGGNRQVARDGL